MTFDTVPNGVIRETDDGYDVIFVRRLRKPIEKVWAALTVPERIADWFAEMRFTPELRLGARVELRFPDDHPPYEITKGEVVAFDPPRLFAWSWPETDHPNSVVRCELEPDGDGCVLTFSQSGMGTMHVIGTASGWQVFLDGLEGAAEGVRTPADLEREMALRPAYEARLAAVTTVNDSDGVVRRVDDGYELVFVRRLSRPIDKVWAALTVRERIADWLAPVTIEPDLRVGARFNLDFGDGKERTPGDIVALDPPRLIAWTWPASADEAGPAPSVIRFRLAPDGDGCVLTLTSTGAGAPHPNELAGWHTHLEGLEDAADGRRRPLDLRREATHELRYEAVLAAF
jgi:uncharacterized protein YndB with AHSA1/START domain